MRVTALLGSVGFVCAMGSVAHAQWLDNFDSYVPGPLAAQSAWEEWYGSSGVDATVNGFQSFTSPNSVLIITNNDVVYDFANLPAGRPSSGVWTTSIKTFVPRGSTGIGWYILMNDYPLNLHWSVQTTFNTSTNRVIDGAAQTRLKYDEWVSLVVAIDLDNDRYDSWYGNKPLAVNRQWTDVGGQTVISAVDLYGDGGGLSGLYYDNARIEKTAGGALVLNTAPNPIVSGQTLDIYSQSPLLTAGNPGYLFLWSVNGFPFVLPLIPTSFDAAGEYNLSTTVPPGISGLELGFKMFGLDSTGNILLSNEEVLIFL